MLQMDAQIIYFKYVKLSLCFVTFVESGRTCITVILGNVRLVSFYHFFWVLFCKNVLEEKRVLFEKSPKDFFA